MIRFKTRRCPHCMSKASKVYCIVCNREMCDDCISIDNRGGVCGLCYDREEGRKRWEYLKAQGLTTLDFDEWYDGNG